MPHASNPAQARPDMPAQDERDPDLATLEGPLLRRGRLESTDTTMEVLDEANSAWDARDSDRRRRRRHRNYVFGLQWQDTIEHEGQTMTEREAIEGQGREPWQMNHLRPVIRNLKGQLRQNSSDRAAFAVDREDSEAAEQMTKALREARRINMMDSLEADNFLEHLMGGEAAFHIGYKYQSQYDRPEVTYRVVNMLRFFVNPDANDRRGHDISLIGEIHDMEVSDIVAQFASNNPQAADAIREYYGDDRMGRDYWGYDEFNKADSLDFYSTADADMNRVIEVWRRELRESRIIHDPAEPGRYEVEREEYPDERIEQENKVRRQQGIPPLRVEDRSEMGWMGYFLTPTGEVLWAGESPYWHQEHPYAYGWAEKMDNESRGLLVDLIDQQRLYNRMIQVIDLGMSTSARGVLMIPKEQIPQDMSVQDFADEYTKANGVIAYKADPDDSNLPRGTSPEQVFNRSIPSGAFQWLQQMRNELQEVSGISGAVMGEEPPSDQPAALYQARIQQSQITTLDLFETYFGILQKADRKALKVARQFFEDGRLVRGSKDEVTRFDRARVRDTEFEVTIAEVADTATYRQLYEQDLKEFLGGGMITFRQFLKMSSHPKADQLLQVINRSNPLSGQGEGGADMNNITGTGDPETEQAIRQAAQASEMADQPIPGAEARELRDNLMEQAAGGDSNAEALLAQAA
jgi:hypothetical protein